MRLINRIVVHCSDSAWGDAAVIRDWHRERGWSDIGYHVVILNGFRKNSRRFTEEDDGRLEPGRPLDRMGAHVRGANRGSLGVCLIGKEEFTPYQFSALERLLLVWAGLYGVERGRIVGHRDLDRKKTCPNFEVRDFLETIRGLR